MSEISKHTETIFHQPPSLAVYERFSEPPDNWTGRGDKNEAITPKPYGTALIIGRFQPFHLGHLYLLYKTLEISDEIVIGIGSSNVLNKENPLTSFQRHLLLERRLANEGIRDKVKNIVHLKDFQNRDGLWLKSAELQAGQIDVVVGNNPWVNSIFQNAGYKVEEVDEFDRENLSGKNCRKELEEEGHLDFLQN